MAAVIMMKLDSPKRFYADPAVSLVISFIIFGSALPLSMSTVTVSEENIPQEFYFKLNRSFEDWKNPFRGFSDTFRPHKGERRSSLGTFSFAPIFFDLSKIQPYRFPM